MVQDDDTLLFASIRTRLDDEGGREGNFGLGLRHMLGDGWNLGGYGYFDRRRSDQGNYFSQVTIGAELLGRDWDVRANAYIPVGITRREVDSLNTAELSGTSVIFRGGEEHSLGGFDGEIGWRLPLFDAESGTNLRLC
ncbi:MAG: inverse autotransporter beta domain-containing protein, partial [Rhodospirillales bacterium]